MRRKSFGDMPCPIARGLERVGEWWSILILRDAFYGLTRFDEFRKSLGIAPNMLTRRLDEASAVPLDFLASERNRVRIAGGRTDLLEASARPAAWAGGG